MTEPRSTSDVTQETGPLRNLARETAARKVTKAKKRTITGVRRSLARSGCPSAQTKPSDQEREREREREGSKRAGRISFTDRPCRASCARTRKPVCGEFYVSEQDRDSFALQTPGSPGTTAIDFATSGVAATGACRQPGRGPGIEQTESVRCRRRETEKEARGARGRSPNASIVIRHRSGSSFRPSSGTRRNEGRRGADGGNLFLFFQGQ